MEMSVNVVPITSAPGRVYGGATAAERSESRRARLLDAALELIVESGTHAVSKRSVCARARLNDRYFYEHFADVPQLLSQAAERLTWDGLAAVLEALAAAPTDVDARAVAAARAGMAFIIDNPGAAAMVKASSNNSTLHALRVQTTILIATQLCEQIAPGEGDARDARLRTVGFVVIAGLFELTGAWLEDAFPNMGREELTQAVARTLTDFTRTHGVA